MSKVATARKKASGIASTKPGLARRGYITVVANSPGPRKHSYEEFLEKYRTLKAEGKIKGSRVKLPVDEAGTESSSTSSSTPMRGQFTADEISRAINKAKGRQRN